MKKTLSLILALLMSASCAVSIFADEAEATSVITEDAPADTEVETPVEEEATEYDLAVQFLVYKQIMQGKGTTEDGELILGVKDPVKRYEMAVFAGRIATGWTKSTDWENGEDDRTQFTDLEGSGAAASYGILSYVAEKDIIKGYPDGSFKPENTVTYRDALAIVVRTLGYTGLEYPWGIIEKAVTLGLTDGITGVAYTDTINRGVAAQIMYNALFKATTAKGTKLAMDSFGVAYGWENILVVADDVAVYEVGGKATKDTKGIVSFKLVEDNGELSDDVYYVHADIDDDKVADLEFGKFYNALFEIDADKELVDMIGAIKYEAEVIKNEGITDDEGVKYTDATPIKTLLADYSIVDKYNVKNLSKDTLYNDEIIVVGEASEEIVIDYNYAKDSKYAINWDTGDILEKQADGTYKTLWYYNEQYEVYFQYKQDATIDTEVGEIAGISVMSDKELEELQKSIKAAYEVKAKYDGYKGYGGAFDTAYAALTAYDFDGDDMYDYAQYKTYKFGTYEGIKGDGDAKKCADCDNLKSYKIGGSYYPIAGTCDHFKAGNDATYTITEVTPGYTGYVIFNVDDAANTIEIIKEIPAYGKNTDKDSYVATGIVRGVNIDNCTVTIDNEAIKFDYDKLEGTDYTSGGKKDAVNKFFKSMFNQFVEYVLVDGKLVKIDVKGATAKNYIVVEDYYGIDSDGYIVVRGYTTDKLELTTFRIGAFDGWKTGSGFFYNEEEMEEYFEKGNVYQITSVDNTQKNGNVYYVTAIATVDQRGNIGTVKGLQDFAIENATVAKVDNYRVTSYLAKSTDTELTKVTKRLDAGQKYVIIGNVANGLDNYMPIYTYTGKLLDGWTVTGDLLVADDNLFIICNVDYIRGFDFDTYGTGFVVLFDKYIKNVSFDGYDSDYYVYGSTEYTVEAFNLLTGKTDDYAAGHNLDLDVKGLYTTIGKTIVSDADLTWTGENGFWANVQDAYAEYEEIATDLYFANKDKEYDFSYRKVTTDDLKDGDKETISSKIIAKMLFGSDAAYKDLVADAKVYELKLKNGKVDKIDSFKWADDIKKDYAYAYVIYDVKAEKVVIYVDVDTANNNPEPPKAPTAAIWENKLEVTTDDQPAYETEINGGAGITATIDKDGYITAATLDSLTFTWGDATKVDATDDTLKAVMENGFYFGKKGQTINEKWETLVSIDGGTPVRVYGTIAAECYEVKDEINSDVAEDIYALFANAVKSVTIKDLKTADGKAISLSKKITTIEVSFVDNSFMSTPIEWNFKVAAEIEGKNVNAWFARKGYTHGTDDAFDNTFVTAEIK